MQAMSTWCGAAWTDCDNKKLRAMCKAWRLCSNEHKIREIMMQMGKSTDELMVCAEWNL